MGSVYGLTEDDLADYRQEQTDHLADGGHAVIRRADTSDGAGGQTRGYTLLDDPVPARLGLPVAGEVQLLHDRFGIEAGWTVTVPHGTNLELHDLVTFDTVRNAKGDPTTVDLVGKLTRWSWETAERWAAVEWAEAVPEGD